MPNYIALPDTQKLDARQRTNDGNVVLIQRGELIHATNARINVLNSSNLAAGAAVSLDCSTVATGKTGQFMKAFVASTVPCRWTLARRDGGSVSTFMVVFTSGISGNCPTLEVSTADKWDSVVALPYGNGDENYRITITNLDQENAADVYATLWWDEIDTGV